VSFVFKNMPDFSFIQITDHHLLESEEQIREGFVPGHALRMVMKHIADMLPTRRISSSPPATGRPGTEAAVCHQAGLSSSAALPGPQRVNTEGLHDYPMYFLPGNHDDRELMTRCLFPDSKPVELYNFTFEHKGQFMDQTESKAVLRPGGAISVPSVKI
jgi:hypothetical protein